METVGKESFYCTHNPLQRKEEKKSKAKILIIPCYNIHIFKSHNSPNHLHTRQTYSMLNGHTCIYMLHVDMSYTFIYARLCCWFQFNTHNITPSFHPIYNHKEIVLCIIVFLRLLHLPQRKYNTNTTLKWRKNSRICMFLKGNQQIYRPQIQPHIKYKPNVFSFSQKGFADSFLFLRYMSLTFDEFVHVFFRERHKFVFVYFSLYFSIVLLGRKSEK